MIRPMFNPIAFGTDFIFSIILIVLSFIIFYKTKQVSDLTKHKGISYFRKTFLFLALAYISRLISSMLILLRINLDIARFPLIPISFIFISFFSTMAIIYLFLSISWKELHGKYIDIISMIIVLIISIIVFILREPLILIICQAVLLILTAGLSYKLHKKSNKFSKLFVIYILFFIFWILGLAPLSSKRLIPHGLGYLAHLLAFIVFLIIFYKFHKWVK